MNAARRIDLEQSKVKQRVDVGSKQQSVDHMVGIAIHVGNDVGGLEHRLDLAARHRALSIVGFDQVLPELRLTAAADNLRQYLLAPIDQVFRVKNSGIDCGFCGH
ncbi:hypothetical protein D3C86_1590730 [compost metagenome]